jgi:hypothetical protein
LRYIECVTTAVRFAALIVAVACLVSCGDHPHRGDALVDANGAGYIACGGATALAGRAANEKDPGTSNYEVIFDDPLGQRHDLRMVTDLNIIDLPNGAPACKHSPSHSAANPDTSYK